MIDFLKKLWAGLMEPGRSMTQKTVRGAVWLAISVGLEQVIILVQTFILWRLLTPEDFGISGIAMVAIVWAQVLTETGFNRFLVQHKTISPELLDTALWFQIARNFLQFTALFALASPIAAWLADKPGMSPDEVAALRLTIRQVLRVFSLKFLFVAFRSPGTQLVIREMNFKRHELFERTYNLLGFAVTITAGFILRSYWAIIVGYLALGFADLVGSYLMYPYRPRFRFRWRYAVQILRYGLHVWLLGILHCAGQTLDEIVLAKLLSTAHFGIYKAMKNLAAKPVGTLWVILQRVTFPAYAKLQHDLERLSRSFVRIVALTATLALPVFAGLAIVAPSLVTFVYRGKANTGISVFILFCAFSACQILNNLHSPLYLGAGKPQLGWIRQVVALLVYAPVLILATQKYGMAGSAAAQVLHGIVLLVSGTILTWRIVGIRLGMLLGALVRPCLATGIMLAALLPIVYTVADTRLRWLFILPAAGVAVYALATLTLNAPALREMRTVAHSLMSDTTEKPPA